MNEAAALEIDETLEAGLDKYGSQIGKVGRWPWMLPTGTLNTSPG